jgi:hypothetical protein
VEAAAQARFHLWVPKTLSTSRDVGILVDEPTKSIVSCHPVGARYSVTSCDLRILMDQPLESISSHDASSRQDDRWFGRPERWWLPQGAMRAVHAVMIGVLGQHRPQPQQTKTSIRSSSSRRTAAEARA